MHPVEIQIREKIADEKVYTLYRVSTKKQVNTSEEHGNDIPMQRGACHDFVKNMQDWEIVKEYEEKGVSGFKVSAKDRDAIIDLQEAALNFIRAGHSLMDTGRCRAE